MSSGRTHIPVMPSQVLALLAPAPGEVVVDCTIGSGGHAAMLGHAVGRNGTVVGFDADQSSLDVAATAMRGSPAKFIAIHANFDQVRQRLEGLGLRADCVLADLGFSSRQIEDPGRGMSFTLDGPLDMRLDTSQGPTAADLLAGLTERELADVIYRNGEDPFARRIARKLAQIRDREPIRTTARLADAVIEAYGPRARSSRLHPATRTFMALRIAVNDELGSLQRLLESIAFGAERAATGAWLATGARVAVIAFHSLEDRLVKRAFASIVQAGWASRLTRKPLVAGEEEVRDNPRARSAKLRGMMVHRSSSRPVDC